MSQQPHCILLLKVVFEYSGNTPLHIAAEHGIKVVIKHLLLDYGTDPNITDARGCTALLYAAQHGYKDVVQLLLRNVATNKKGKTPLHRSCKNAEEGNGENEGRIRARLQYSQEI